MRFRLFLALTSASFITAGLAVQACGGDTTESSPTPTADATPEATTAKDTSTADTAADSAPKCDPNKNYLGDIPDASIADGASTTSACVTCVRSFCQKEVAACGADCTCQSVATDALECFSKTMAPSCATPFLTVPPSTQALGQKLLVCVNGGCSKECAIGSFLDAGADADAGM